MTATCVDTLADVEGLHLLSPEIITSLYTLDMAYASQVEAFTELASGNAWQPDKIGGGHAGDDSTVFCYAARLNRDTGPISKFGSVNPGNTEQGLPSIHAMVVLLHPDTGIPVAILDGTAITARRTAAASAVAATNLAGQAAQIAVLGSGQQGVAHVHSLHRRFPSASFTLWSPDTEQVGQAVEGLRARGITIASTATVSDTLHGADIVVTATQAVEPLFDAEVLAPDALVISIGSFESHRCEIGADTLQRSTTVVVDHAPTARAHCGPLVDLQRRNIDTAVTELGHVIIGAAPPPAPGLTTYLSVGLGVQDAAAAWSIYRRARELGLGTTVQW